MTPKHPWADHSSAWQDLQEGAEPALLQGWSGVIWMMTFCLLSFGENQRILASVNLQWQKTGKGFRLSVFYICDWILVWSRVTVINPTSGPWHTCSAVRVFEWLQALYPRIHGLCPSLESHLWGIKQGALCEAALRPGSSDKHACVVGWALSRSCVPNPSSLLWLSGKVQVKPPSPPDRFKEHFVIQIPHSWMQPLLSRADWSWRDLMFRWREHDLPFLSFHFNTVYN